MGTFAKQGIDLSCEVSSLQYFKSSFARSMAVDCMNQSKSLDNAFLDRPPVCEKSSSYQTEYHTDDIGSVWTSSPEDNKRNCKTVGGIATLCKGNKLLQNECDLPYMTPIRKNNRPRSQNTDAAKLWKTKQDVSSGLVNQNDINCNSRLQSPGNSYAESDIARLRQECQGLLEENKRLQAALELRSASLLNGRSLQLIDSTILQSRVDTLQWQLKQAESSRQMYRAVMEQVVRFLERVYKNLDLIKNKMDPGGYSNKSSSSRVPRSRSVHTVDVSPSRESAMSGAPPHFPRAKSIAQFEASPNYSTFRDFTWRRPRHARSEPDDVPPEKLSQEAFRLLRTAQSLLNTREPDLVQRLCPEIEREVLPDHASSNCHNSSLRSSVHDPDDVNLDKIAFNSSNSQKPEHVSLSTGSCNSLLQQSLDTSSLHSIKCNTNNSSLTSGLESAFAGGCRTVSPSYTSSLGRPQKCKASGPLGLESGYATRGSINSSPVVPQLSISSTEDESGFSSMNSFQEVGLPLVNQLPKSSYSRQSPSCNETQFQPNTENMTNQSTAYCGSTYQELGLPVVDVSPNSSNKNGTTPAHRRWSSSPAETISHYTKNSASFCGAGETLKVLWV